MKGEAKACILKQNFSRGNLHIKKAGEPGRLLTSDDSLLLMQPNYAMIVELSPGHLNIPHPIAGTINRVRND